MLFIDVFEFNIVFFCFIFFLDKKEKNQGLHIVLEIINGEFAKL